MNRRHFLLSGLAAGLIAEPARAQSFTDSVVSQLRGQGFRQIAVERTLLGRTRIVATGNGGRREIILNPRTGEILRDLWITSGSGGGSGLGSGNSGGGLIEDDDGGKGRGRGRGGDDSDDDDSGDDDDDDSGGGGDDDDD